jgi:hypothetical protein
LELNLPYNYQPRWYQLPSWNALINTGTPEGDPKTDVRRMFELVHRRGGKDLEFFNVMQCKLAQRVGTYIHVFPTLKEGRRVIWNGITKDGRRFLDYIPDQTEYARTKAKNLWVTKKRDDDMFIEYQNGSIYQVLGADDPDSIRGMGPIGVILSEYAFFKGPQVWDIIRPMLAENGGWIVFVTTPDGRNHAYALHQNYKRLVRQGKKQYFEETLPASHTKAVPEFMIEEDRESGMSEEKIRSEYEVDYDAAVEGSFYGMYMDSAHKQGRITDVPWQPNLPVDTFWDIGVDDPTAIWFTQKVGNRLNVIDFEWRTGEGIHEISKMVLNEKPYTYRRHFGPHDLKQRAWSAAGAARRTETARSLGINFSLVDKDAIEDGITAVRALFPSLWFDEVKCELGLAGLGQYRKTRIEGLVGPNNENLYSNVPVKNWATHPADALRTGAMGLVGFRYDSDDLPESLAPKIAMV